MQIDIKVAQLLNSRLFHDLLGAVTAINNGIEFISEPGSHDDAIDLLKVSADRLGRRINFFRGAFGLGGGKTGELSISQAGFLVSGWFFDSKSVLSWPPEKVTAGLGVVKPSSVKVLMILSMIAEECLPRGGEVAVQINRLTEGLGIAVSASGRGACHPAGMQQALANSCGVEDLSARSVVGHVCAQLAHSLKARIESAQSADRVDFASLIPCD